MEENNSSIQYPFIRTKDPPLPEEWNSKLELIGNLLRIEI